MNEVHGLPDDRERTRRRRNDRLAILGFGLVLAAVVVILVVVTR